VAVDLVAVRLMGFDERCIPKISESMGDPGPRVTAVRDPSDVVVGEVQADGSQAREISLDDIAASHVFAPHPGWRGYLERTPR